jgi:imidazolonepropionase-like amidohydrolase
MKLTFHLLLAFALTFGSTVQAKAQSETLLTDVIIVDLTDSKLTPGQSVLIRDGMIAEIGADIAAEEPARLDGDGGYLIPGL